ncbi:ribosome small subunit-dependent GTPase A [Bacteroidales bacterium]|nr:ribosome small subunit-dependent GTPase A [Bacteroidales bacterium]
MTKSAKGLVIKSTGSWYLVKDSESGKLLKCKLKGKFRIKGIKATNPVTVGDIVHYDLDAQHDGAVITNIEKRKNYIIRRSSNLSKQYHLLAANVDLAVLVVTIISPETYLEFIDRYLISAEAYRVPVLLVFNKIDIYDEKAMIKCDSLIETYEKIGYECLKTSVTENINIELFKTQLSGKISVINGNSGVGKSSLINAVCPDMKLKTNNVSDQHKTGKHTTTFAELHEVEGDIKLIDTPGIRGFGTIDLEKKQLFHYFREIFEASGDCKFNNCQHMNEPGCNVKKLVKSGEISTFRYQNYLSILCEEEGKYR